MICTLNNAILSCIHVTLVNEINAYKTLNGLWNQNNI